MSEPASASRDAAEPSRPADTTRRLPPGAASRRAVVVGGGLAGLLAAAALHDYAEVTVVERDALPEGPSRGGASRRPAMPICCGPAAPVRWRSCCPG